jgi:hypothetical protein
MHRFSARWNWGLYDAIALHHEHLMGADNRFTGSAAEFSLVVGRELENAYFLHFYRLFAILEALRPQLVTRR